MLTHENFTSNIVAISKGLPIKKTDRSLAVLPLSHIFERTVFYVLCSNGVSIHYCASFEQFASHLAEVKPTIMTAVPRLFEQVYHKIVKKGKAAGGWKTTLFNWALEVGQEYWEAKDITQFGFAGFGRETRDCQPSCFFKMARRCRRQSEIFCFRRRAAFEKIILRILGGGHSDSARLRDDRSVRNVR